TRVDARQTAFFFERGTDRGWRPAGAFGVTFDLLIDFSVRHFELLASRDLVEDQRARHRLARRISLGVPARLPVPPGLPRTAPLIHQSSGEVLQPPIRLALDQR